MDELKRLEAGRMFHLRPADDGNMKEAFIKAFLVSSCCDKPAQCLLQCLQPSSKTYGRKRSDPANFQRFPEAGFGNRFRAPVPIDFRQIRVSGPY